ncbi:ribonuclease H [Halorhabdus sp. BNX81]|uniref:ribonuclease H n=1 Tax=Halorhabdus sp. BNX81 TaxID=2980181 RepID=UPI0023DD2149|nr:ribonuclease H [Halorhabdus sp. BNX81]WEL21614.1 Ribonuclease HI [Halorhabdus sp. BNX81]
MAAYGRPNLRDLFDDSPTPHIAHPPRTHHRDFYLATDGSFHGNTGGLGVVIETRDGECVARLSVPDSVPDNNIAEYRALHFGLDVLAARTPSRSRVGVLVDHDELAANVNAAILDFETPDEPSPHRMSIPPSITNHWRGIQARVSGFHELRVARIESDRNPAHPLANAPEEYAHVNDECEQCLRPEPPADGDRRIPPPSRADRPASD